MRAGLCLPLLFALLLACSTSGAEKPPLSAPPPTLDPRLQSLGGGSIPLAIDGGRNQEIDPMALASKTDTPPACSDFVFLFTWASDSAEMRFVGNRDGALFDIGAGPQGQASVAGCVLIEALNDGKSSLRGEMRYIVAKAAH